jgi:lysophospholipase L1-like esterase
MGILNVRRRRAPLATGLAAVALVVGGLTAAPAQAAAPPKISFVAVGDSYTAGTGAGAADNPLTGPCWQSHPNYVDDVGATGRVSLVANGACHGALLAGGLATSVLDQITGLALQGKLSGSTGLVSMTAGANDAGVYAVLSVCATSPEAACKAAIDLSSAALPAIGQGLAATYLYLKRVAPAAQVAVLGYPHLFAPASGAAVIPPENQALVNQATDNLNATIARAVAAANTLGANAQYIDVTARFAGHEANTADSWLVLDRAHPTADYNFHPNATGYSEGYAAALMGAAKPAQLLRR